MTTATNPTVPFLRTVEGDIDPTSLRSGVVYAHEHLIIDSPLIADRFPDIHLWDVETGVEEVTACSRAGVVLMVDAMPMASGRVVTRLAEIAVRTGVRILSATGLHHDRYYGPSHWSNHVWGDELADLFVADLVKGIDRFDYTGPIIRRTPHRAGLLKVATSGAVLDDRDRRNLDAVAQASVRTGASVLTHCEGGAGGLAQIERLTSAGVPAGQIILSHVDKQSDLGYLGELAATGAVLELDQATKNRGRGTASPTVAAIGHLVERGYTEQIVVGTDGARRALWRSLGGEPGLSWLAGTVPQLLTTIGLSPAAVDAVMRGNAVRSLAWTAPTA